ncbi:MAG: PTS sugar transporter subunit IIB [Coprobacillus sp.]
MIHIMLCCASGMSTSLLVEKMKKSASEKGIQADIWAIGANEVKANADKADVILLGPQVKYAQKKIEEEAAGVPVGNIDMRDYGMMNGASVLQQAIDMIEKKQ